MRTKLKLDLEHLSVESFDTVASQKPKGTVFGEQCTCWTNCDTCPGCPTCDASCNGTCGDSCGCNTGGGTCGWGYTCGDCTALQTNCDQVCL